MFKTTLCLVLDHQILRVIGEGSCDKTGVMWLVKDHVTRLE